MPKPIRSIKTVRKMISTEGFFMHCKSARQAKTRGELEITLAESSCRHLRVKWATAGGCLVLARHCPGWRRCIRAPRCGTRCQRSQRQHYFKLRHAEHMGSHRTTITALRRDS
jgi:hypothetical protein